MTRYLNPDTSYESMEFLNEFLELRTGERFHYRPPDAASGTEPIACTSLRGGSVDPDESPRYAVSADGSRLESNSRSDGEYGVR